MGRTKSLYKKNTFGFEPVVETLIRLGYAVSDIRVGLAYFTGDDRFLDDVVWIRSFPEYLEKTYPADAFEEGRQSTPPEELTCEEILDACLEPQFVDMYWAIRGMEARGEKK